MGKSKQRTQRRRGRHLQDSDDDDSLPSSAFETSDISPHSSGPGRSDRSLPCGFKSTSKFELYQLSVQSPKGDISYLVKFFLTYVGGRSPCHLREDFCGTALICSEWLKGGIQRVATGVDLDVEALVWGLNNNFQKLGGDSSGRVCLLNGNVLHPLSSAKMITSTSTGVDFADKDETNLLCNLWPAVDIVCAFNYSCCCLHRRSELVSYFKHVLNALSIKGGIFAMDLYGGISSEAPLKLRRRFPAFTYIWEQEAVDVLTRMTKISLHFQLKDNKMLRHAFTYHWRLWSLPEVRDSLEEAGFDAVHFWLRNMPELEGEEDNEDICLWDDDSKYEETSSFYQQNAWNAYVVAVAHRKFDGDRHSVTLS